MQTRTEFSIYPVRLVEPAKVLPKIATFLLRYYWRNREETIDISLNRSVDEEALLSSIVKNSGYDRNAEGVYVNEEKAVEEVCRIWKKFHGEETLAVYVFVQPKSARRRSFLTGIGLNLKMFNAATANRQRKVIRLTMSANIRHWIASCLYFLADVIYLGSRIEVIDRDGVHFSACRQRSLNMVTGLYAPDRETCSTQLANEAKASIEAKYGLIREILCQGCRECKPSRQIAMKLVDVLNAEGII